MHCEQSRNDYRISRRCTFNAVFLTVTLSAEAGTTFRGFFLQIRSTRDELVPGIEVLDRRLSQILNCFDQKNVSLHYCCAFTF